ncbi:hypothetical protein ACJRO7_032308 [Eucalyptus globulus]|uniref:Uncharacterized protein n=1 Tax=Eucalyptus globulus TaxID=34317 RepID=A0ABD3JIT1_EUCGL
MEKEQRRVFARLRSMEESFFRQKSRVRWLKEEDRNTKFFHQYVKKRQLRNRVLSIQDSEGNLISDPQRVQQCFLQYFQDLLAPQAQLGRPSVEEIREVIQHPLSID